MKKLLIKIYLGYLRFFAKAKLRKMKPIIIGVGGSSGKSSTSHLISEVLGTKYSVLNSKGKNSETGIPLSILGINMSSYSRSEWLKVLFLAPLKFFAGNKKYNYFVAEMGIDSPKYPKNMEYLLKIMKPNIGLLTNINIEHSANFDSLIQEKDEKVRKKKILDSITKQEGLLLKSIDSSGRSVINLDDTSIKSLLPLRSKTVSISAKDKKADYFISSIRVTENSFETEFIFLKDKYSLKLNSPLPKHFAYTFLLTISTSFICGISIKESIKIIQERFSLPLGRFTPFQGIKNTLVLDSSYNSSLDAAIGVLEVVPEIAGKRRKVGILGDMRELGSLSKIQHELLAKRILKDLDYAILIGPMMSEFAAPILISKDFKFDYFQSFKEAKGKILEKINSGDVILIKGSQNTLYLERIVEMLLADKKDIEKLCRRGEFWDKVRGENG